MKFFFYFMSNQKNLLMMINRKNCAKVKRGIINISVFSINLILYSIYINYNYSSWSCASLLYCFHKKKYEKYYLEFPLGDNSLPVGVVITYTLFSIHCRHYFEFWAGFALAVGQPKKFQNCGDAIINVKLHSYTSIGR